MQQIERGIYYEDSYLGVAVGALVFTHGVIFIDAPLRAEDARSWRSMLINQRGGTNRLLINLDAHPDRTLGTRALECTIVAHQQAAQVFRNRPTIFKGQTVESGAIWETYNDSIGMRWAAPDITFSQSMSLNWGGPEVVLEHHPGPSAGSIWVIIPDSRVIFIGDTLVVNQPPFLAQADLEAWLESLDVLKNLYENFTILSGRGGLIKKEDIRFHQKLLKDIRNKMEQLAARNGMPEATQDMVSPIMAKFKLPPELRELCAKRLLFGLHHCFARRYHAVSSLGDTDMDTDENQ